MNGDLGRLVLLGFPNEYLAGEGTLNRGEVPSHYPIYICEPVAGHVFFVVDREDVFAVVQMRPGVEHTEVTVHTKLDEREVLYCETLLECSAFIHLKLQELGVGFMERAEA